MIKGIIKILKVIVKLLISIVLFPFKIIIRLLTRVLKRLRFSIAFKISASYFLLYVFIIVVVAATTSAGFLFYEFKKYDYDVMSVNFENIKKSFPDSEKIDSLLEKNGIENIFIFDDELNMVYTSGEKVRYSQSIIAIIENLIYNKEYIYSSSFYHGGSQYYLNVTYSAEDKLNDTIRLFGMILVSGAIGLLIFVPVASSTGYRLIGPIKNMTEITKTITVNNINTRLDIKGAQDELKELSRTFNEMMDRIEEGYKSQQQFVSDASHELRTPIAVIKGYVNMLDRWGKNDKDILEESIVAIKNETESMQDLIEKLLFIARSDKQTLTFTKDDFKISDILTEIERETTIIDTKHVYTFKFYSDALVYADKNRIKQTIRIFLENAMKFTPQGGNIGVSSFIDGGFYIIRVSDTGIGIERNDLNKIFDRLYRAEESRNRNIGGHGLGLSIAKIIILGHKGKIKVKSTVGKGSEFSIMLPYLEVIDYTNPHK